MNFKIFFFTSISLLLVLAGCKSNKNNDQELSLVNSISKNAINNLDSETADKIVGLWKVYKLETKEGINKIESENYYLNLKADRTYESNDSKGNWCLSYGILNGEMQTYFTFIPNKEGDSNSDDAKIKKVSISVENQTTFLKLTDFYNFRTRTLVHQN